MPSGFTQKLYDKEQPFEDFVLGVAKSSGYMWRYRDNGLDTLPDSITVDTKYYEEQLEDALNRKKKVESWNVKEMQNEADAAFDFLSNRYEASVRETSARRKRYEEMIQKINAWECPESSQQLKDYMVEHLIEVQKHDCYTLTEPVRQTGSEYKKEQLHNAIDDIAYYEGQIEKEKEYEAKTNKWISELKESLRDTNG
jgi:hypothetical protein